MSSTYSTNLALELIGTGDQAGTWGNTTNTNLGTLIEQAISGYVTQAVSTGTDTTITIPNGATGVARNMYIELTGTGGASTNLIVPANKKLYFIFNNTSSGQVTVKVSGQTGVSVPNKAKIILVSNGTDVVDATNYIGNISAASANITVLTSASATITNLIATSASITTLTNNPTFSGGTANGVLYLNGSKVATSGSALTFNGTDVQVGSTSGSKIQFPRFSDNAAVLWVRSNSSANEIEIRNNSGSLENYLKVGNGYLSFGAETTEGMRLTSTGLGIGTSSPGAKLHVQTSAGYNIYFQTSGSAVRQNYLNDAASANVAAAYRANTYEWQKSDGSPTLNLTDSGNLGIGTSSPSAKLHVKDATGTAVTLLNLESGYSNPSGNKSILWTDATNALGRISISYTASTGSTMSFGSLYNGGYQTSDLMVLTNTGNLGLGVTPSAWSTSYRAFEFGSGSLMGRSTNTDIYLLSNSYLNTSGNFVYKSSAAAGHYSQATGAHYWYRSTDVTPTAGGTISFTQAMTLDADGDLLVGTTTAASGTSVRQVLSNSIGAGIQLHGTSSSAGGLINSANGAGLTFYSYTGAVGSESYSERARITSGGDLLVGRTSASAVAPRLDVQAANFAMAINTTNGGSDEAVRFYNNGSVAGSITTTSTTTAYNVSSDQRLKKNIQDAPAASDLIDAIQVRSFDWKFDDSHQRYGMVAQELLSVAPEAVYKPEDPDDMMAVDYSKLVPMLVKEIQSLRARVAQLESK
jgi:hypothetical protein